MATGILVPNIPFAPSYGDEPPERGKSVPISLDFSVSTVYSIDFLLLIQQQNITSIQTLYIDNLLNNQTCTVAFQGTSQNVTAPAQSQGYYPVLTQQVARCKVSSSGGVVVNLQFINLPIPPAVWGPGASGAGGGLPSPLPVTISGPSPLPVSGTVALQTPAPNTFFGTARHTIALGVTTQISTILPAGSPTTVKSLTLQSTSYNTASMNITTSVGAVGLELPIGAAVNYTNVDTTLMYVIGNAQDLSLQVLN